MPQYNEYRYPSLNPAYGLGSSNRTGVSISLSNRSKIGSQSRIYSYMNKIGKGEEYIQSIITVLGLKNMPSRYSYV
jgi:hypothetical protein